MSPWPAALVIRKLFDSNGEKMNKALQYISTHHQKYFADKNFIVLAGDSAGSNYF